VFSTRETPNRQELINAIKQADGVKDVVDTTADMEELAEMMKAKLIEAVMKGTEGASQGSSEQVQKPKPPRPVQRQDHQDHQDQIMRELERRGYREYTPEGERVRRPGQPALPPTSLSERGGPPLRPTPLGRSLRAPTSRPTSLNTSVRSVGAATGWSFAMPLKLEAAAWRSWDVSEQVHSGPSRWSVSNDVIIQLSNIYSGSPDDGVTARRDGTLHIYQSGFGGAGEFYLEMRSSDDDAIGVAFNFQDPAHHYLFAMDAQRSSRVLAIKHGNTYRILDQNQEGYEIGKCYQVRIARSGPQITVYVNGRKDLEAVDETFRRGTIALYSWGSKGVQFRRMWRRDSDKPSGYVTVFDGKRRMTR
jgi:hypothetical protein